VYFSQVNSDVEKMWPASNAVIVVRRCCVMKIQWNELNRQSKDVLCYRSVRWTSCRVRSTDFLHLLLHSSFRSRTVCLAR